MRSFKYVEHEKQEKNVHIYKSSHRILKEVKYI